MAIKVLHINTSDSGGAAIAAIRTHLGLLEIGVGSSYLSLFKSKGGIPNHKIYDGPFVDKTPAYPLLTLKNVLREKFKKEFNQAMTNYRTGQLNEKQYKTPILKDGFASFGLFSYPNSAYDITKTTAYQEADIIHLHWVADFLDYATFFKSNSKPIVWTLHDANPFRGGFHHEDDELRNVDTHKLLDDQFKEIKKEAIASQDRLTVVSPSFWLADEAKKSQMFTDKKILTISNGIDLSIFKPHDKVWARSFFDFPTDTPVFLFASHDIHDYRKGLDLLLPIINNKKWEHALFILAGSNSTFFHQKNVKVLGSIADQRLMSLVYAASDFFLLTSRTDNLPNTMLESIACGTPVIGFPIGDNDKILSDSKCGLVATETSSMALEQVMIDGLERKSEFSVDVLINFAAQHFNQKTQAKLYLKEYEELLQ